MTEDDARAWLTQRYDTAALEKLEAFAVMLARENENQNLISRNSLAYLWSRHIVDSAQLLEHGPDPATGIWLDIGSGAGFPGLILAVLSSKFEFQLVEPRKRRVEWLTETISSLELTNCAVQPVKIDALKPYPVSAISARAVASFERLVALGAPFSAKHTRWVLPKGRSGRQEWADASAYLRKMFHVEHSVSDPEAVILVGQGKMKATS